ncbi:MAG: succinate dehydrogenase assembly factor 2 [Gammaproteobacteria bacterium]|nr:succinate dehydrogenase assembly factor 2 [Gammaproteobacteria bacterium]MYF68213.1 succinate dehydrogenase assembly factor 2 [Gammaproteobacteria bacterium]MYK37483.1 succinate dehydrogenase assembly factor 2 [Gammaproteobacteria bacterium]
MGEHTRLRWRCRRGRRELDLLLERYLDDRYEQADAAERAGFVALLERSDPELEDLLTGRLAPESPQQARVIERIRRHG